MSENLARAEIIAKGLVQGVGFRYFIQRNAEELGLTGYAKNLMNGDVVAVAEGEKWRIDELFKKIKTGPSHSSVKACNIEWLKFKNEFTNFGIRH